MMGYFEKNIEAFKSKIIYKDVFGDFENDMDNTGVYDEYIWDKSVNGEDIFGIKQDEHIFYLNSRYNDEEYIDNWISGFEEINFKGVFIIFGASNYRCVRKIINNTSESNKILVYEPDKELFYRVIDKIDITDVINTERVFIAINGINERFLQEFLLSFISYSNVKYIYKCCMCNYGELYKEQYINLVGYVDAWIDSCTIRKNTLITYADERAENTISNYMDFVSQYTINQIRDKLNDNIDFENIPAILVSAGPSLDKNIKEMKKAVGKAFIFSVDTALKALLNNDIIPDMVITVDGHKDTMLFAHSKFNDISILVVPCSNYKNFPLFSGKHVFFSDGSLLIDYLYAKEKDEILISLESGGSVANSGFSAIKALGFKRIILVGQDLAYPDNKMHTDAAYGIGENNDVTNKHLFEVDDIFGNKVLTEYNMNCYRKWFERQIIRYPELEVIDATEGGAKILGTKIMTLSETIEEYCKTEVDVKKYIDEIEPVFCNEDKKRILEEYNRLPEKYLNMKKKIDKGIRDYERMDMLNRKGKITGSEFNKLVDSVGKLSDELLSSPEMDLASILNQKEEYEVLGEVYSCKNNAYDDINDVVKSGIKMLNAYKLAIDKLLDKMKYVKEVTVERVNKGLCELNKSIEEVAKMCVEENVSDINVSLKSFYNLVANLLTELEACERFENLNLEKNKNEVHNLIEKVEFYTEASDYRGLAGILKDYEVKSL